MNEFAGDEDIQRVYAALSWEADGSRRVRPGLAGSMILHGAVLLPILFGGATGLKHDASQTKIQVVQIFVPGRTSAERRDSPPPTSPKIPSGVVAPDNPATGVTELKVELSGIKLRFVLDTANELPAVVKRRGADLALVQKGDDSPDFAEYLFRSPDWNLQPGPVSLRDRYVLLMDPAEAWAVLSDLEQDHGIRPGVFQGAAVFDIDYMGCVIGAIRNWASSRPETGGTVVSALLKFTLENPCGVVALEVGFAPKSEH